MFWFNELFIYSTNYLHVQQKNYFNSANYLYIQRNIYFDSTNYLYIQRIVSIFNERSIFIEPIKYIYSTNELKYFYFYFYFYLFLFLFNVFKTSVAINAKMWHIGHIFLSSFFKFFLQLLSQNYFQIHTWQLHFLRKRIICQMSYVNRNDMVMEKAFLISSYQYKLTHLHIIRFFNLKS